MAISTKPASGTRDFLPAAVLARRHVVEQIERAYAAHGFVPLETPAFERLAVLTGKYGDEGDQLMFKVLKRGEKLPALSADLDPNDLADLALRYDLTVPLARVVAAYQGRLPRFFKRYQIQPVWRADRPQKGRFREFFQCDVDFVGTRSTIAEATVIAAVTDALAALGFASFDVRLNDRRVLTGLMETARVPEDKRGAVLVAIDKLDKIGPQAVATLLRDEGVSDEGIALLTDAFGGDGAAASAETLAALFEGHSEVGLQGLATIAELQAHLAVSPLAAGRVVFDPSLARGLSYYTGPIFEIRVDGLSGSMGGGGRYDGLIGMFRGTEVPAVGFSLGLERILVVMEERGMLPDVAPKPDVMVAYLDHETVGAMLAFSARARAAGLVVEVFPDKAKLGKQFQYAEQLGIRHVVLLGTDEVEAGVVGLKDLVASTQDRLSAAEAVARLSGG